MAVRKSRGTLGKKQRDLAAQEEKLRRKMAELERVIRQKPTRKPREIVERGIVVETRRDRPWSLHAMVNPALKAPRGSSSLRLERKKVLVQFISLLAILLLLVLLLLSQLM